MKKNIILIIFLLCSTIVFASKRQDTQIDTIQYLRDSVEAVKTKYIGKPLNILLSDLKIQPVGLLNLIDPQYPKKDTVYQSVIYLYFDLREFTPEVMLSSARTKGSVGNTTVPNLHIPCLMITFLNPVPILSTDLEYGHILCGFDWTSAKANIFGSYVISNVEAIEH